MTTELERTLSQVQAQIHRTRISLVPDDQRFLNFNDCVRSQLVTPILEALGWSSADPQEVRVGFTLGAGQDNSSLALLVSGTPCLFIELRSLGEDFDQDRVMIDLLPKADESGFEWVLLTDGDYYDLYNARNGLNTDQRALDSVRLSVDPMGEALEFFELLSKERLKENRIESQWRCRVVDREVERALRGLFDKDSSLAQLLLAETDDLSIDDITCSLSRASVNVDFKYHDQVGASTGAEVEHELECATGMSEAELRVATWLQRKSIERWAKGTNGGQNRTSQRRALENRRTTEDRRSALQDRRKERVAKAEERRSSDDRRFGERRLCADRRVGGDRRCAGRRAG